MEKFKKLVGGLRPSSYRGSSLDAEGILQNMQKNRTLVFNKLTLNKSYQDKLTKLKAD
jgi:hypothetical protein